MVRKRIHPQSISNADLSESILRDLAQALGYDTTDCSSNPHIQYIVDQAPHGKGPLDEYLRLFIDTVNYCKDKSGITNAQVTRRMTSKYGSVQAYIDALVADKNHPFFGNTSNFCDVRELAITDTVLLILGSWLLMLNYFRLTRGQPRRIILAYCVRTGQGLDEKRSLGIPLPNLLKSSGLLPDKDEGQESNSLTASSDANSNPLIFPLHPSLASVESLEISSRELNAFKLVNLSGVRILWTTNISRHMLLSKHAKKHYLELFAIPSALESPGPGHTLIAAGMSSDLLEEIRLSYSNLFNPTKTSWIHSRVSTVLLLRWWCWCLSCSSHRLAFRQLRDLRSFSSVPLKPSCNRDSFRVPFDSFLESLSITPAIDWDQTEFGNLWPRIIALDAHLAGIKPWSFWVIFRDRRDSVQFWTFLFGTILVVLTFLQVFLGTVQVVSTFV